MLMTYLKPLTAMIAVVISLLIIPFRSDQMTHPSQDQLARMLLHHGRAHCRPSRYRFSIIDLDKYL
jgi:hypothetical protein